MNEILNAELLKDYADYLDLIGEQIDFNNNIAEKQLKVDKLKEELEREQKNLTDINKKAYRDINKVEDRNDPERREKKAILDSQVSEINAKIKDIEEQIKKETPEKFENEVLKSKIESYDSELVKKIERYFKIPKEKKSLEEELDKINKQYADINKVENRNDPERREFNAGELRQKASELGDKIYKIGLERERLFEYLNGYVSLKGDKVIEERKTEKPATLKNDINVSFSENKAEEPLLNPTSHLNHPDYLVSGLMDLYKQRCEEYGAPYDKEAARVFCERTVNYMNVYNLNPNKKIDLKNDSKIMITANKVVKKARTKGIEIYKKGLNKANKIIKDYNIDFKIEKTALTVENAVRVEYNKASEKAVELKGKAEKKYKVIKGRVFKFNNKVVQRYDKTKSKVFEFNRKIDKQVRIAKTLVQEYKILNRELNFEPDTCEKINIKNTKIIDVDKARVSYISDMFYKIQKKMADNKETRGKQREELEKEINELKAQRTELMGKTRVKSLNSTGLVSVITLIAISVLAVAIFDIIKTMVIR